MTSFDLIGIQINITDDWPSDQKSRNKLKQASDYIELLNDLKECAALAHALKRDVTKYEHEIQEGVSIAIRRTGFLPRSFESSMLSKYGRCFNSSSGRTSINKKTVEQLLGVELTQHHQDLIDRRDKVIAHAERLEGRQPLKVTNYDQPHSDWRIDISSTHDFIPRFDEEQAKKTEFCCLRIANHCLVKANASFSSFMSDLPETEVETLRRGHWKEDRTGSSYPVFPPASTRS